MGAFFSKPLFPMTDRLGCCYHWVTGMGNKSAASGIVANALTSGVSLKLNDKVPVAVLDMGKVVKTNDKRIRLLLSLVHGHSCRPLSRASVLYRTLLRTRAMSAKPTTDSDPATNTTSRKSSGGEADGPSERDDGSMRAEVLCKYLEICPTHILMTYNTWWFVLHCRLLCHWGATSFLNLLPRMTMKSLSTMKNLPMSSLKTFTAGSLVQSKDDTIDSEFEAVMIDLVPQSSSLQHLKLEACVYRQTRKSSFRDSRAHSRRAFGY